MLRLQVLHRGLVLVVFIKDAVDKLKALEVVVNQHIIVLLLKVVGDEVLIDFQALREWVIGSAQVGLHEVVGRQPPGVSLTFHIVGIGLALVIVGHAVEHKLKQRGFIFDVILVVILVLIQHHEILGLGLFQSLDGLQCLLIVLFDACFETLLVPVFHLHL